MHNHSHYMIAKQHHAELRQVAERARLVADARTPRPEPQPKEGRKPFQQRISAAIAHLAPGASREAW